VKRSCKLLLSLLAPLAFAFTSQAAPTSLPNPQTTNPSAHERPHHPHHHSHKSRSAGRHRHHRNLSLHNNRLSEQKRGA
jgi:hypothetical protein